MRPLLSTLLVLGILPLHAGITVRQEGSNLQVEIDGKPFTTYRADTRVPCLHPLMSAGGTHLTRRFPFEKDVTGEKPDHPHHIGFWFAHGAVSGHDFWHPGEGTRIVTKGFVGKPEVEELEDGDSRASFTVDLAWMAGERPLLTEQRTYAIHATGPTRTIDVTCRLRPTDHEVVFGDTKEGCFAIRVAPTLRLKGKVARGHITTSAGRTDHEAWGQRAKWVAYHGPDAAGTPAVVALLDHRANLRHPTWWHARDYGLLTANPFGIRAFKDRTHQGRGDHTLKKGDTLTQRYRLVLHQGDLASAKLGERWDAFTK